MSSSSIADSKRAISVIPSPKLTLSNILASSLPTFAMELVDLTYAYIYPIKLIKKIKDFESKYQMGIYGKTIYVKDPKDENKAIVLYGHKFNIIQPVLKFLENMGLNGDVKRHNYYLIMGMYIHAFPKFEKYLGSIDIAF